MYLYIMSRSHSGSTILDILLGSSGSIAGCGEIVRGLRRGGEASHACSCGAALADCPFWQQVRVRVGEDPGEPVSWAELAEASIAQAHKSRLLPTWLAARAPGRQPEDLRRLAVMTRRLSAAIAAVSGRPVVLDSTKMTSRGLFLLRYLPEARLIHMVRDPRSVVASHRWRLPSRSTYVARRRLYRGPLAALALVEATVMWLIGNLLCELVARAGPGRVVRLRYEDLRDRPVAEIRRLGAALGLDLEDVVLRLERGETFPIGHMIGGNDVRLEGQVRFDPQKEASREQLPRPLEWLAVLCCWPLMLRYGYPLRRARPAAPGGPAMAREEGAR
jgi:Sulfotransferase family